MGFFFLLDLPQSNAQSNASQGFVYFFVDSSYIIIQQPQFLHTGDAFAL